MKHVESAERTRIANERVARCLERLGVKDKPLLVKYFEIAFIDFVEDGKVVKESKRKRVLKEILTGNARPKHGAWLKRLELFTDLVVKMRKG